MQVWFKNKIPHRWKTRQIHITWGQELICNDRYRKRKSGQVTTTKVHRCFDWNKEGQKTKGIYIAETFQKYREESLKNIKSDQGIEERINRSIQAEGAFSKTK